MTRALARSGTSLAMVGCAILCGATAAHAQARVDTLFLDDLQRSAESADHRSAQRELLTRQSLLRLQGIRNERLPSLNASGTAQYLSDVAKVGALLPGVRIPGVYNDQYDASVTVRQPLLDPSRRGRAAVEQAQALEAQARLRALLWQQRVVVSDAFFGIVLRETQRRALDVAIADLDVRIRIAANRVTAGTALPSEQLLLEAERARRQQVRDETVSERDALRDVLATLVGRDLPSTAVFIARVPVAAATYTRGAADTIRTRPEFAQFERTRALLDARRAATTAQDLPRLSAFGRSGYGRPGLNPLGRSFDTYWSAGLQLEWTPWNWGRTHRDLEVLTLQEAVVRSDEAAFQDGIARAGITERARLQALASSLVTDDSIVSLRDRILRETRLRYDEGEVNAADYIARLSEHLSAQLDRDLRRVRLDEARARYLTMLGLEVR